MKKCFIDYRTSEKEIEKLKYLNLEIIKIPLNKNLYTAINGHPDIQLNIVTNNTLIVHKDFDISLLGNISKLNIITSINTLKEKYPNNIFLNAVTLKDFFIHNLKFTDKKLLDMVKEKTLINVKQGYTRCSCAIISENALITSDINIYNTLKKYPDLDVLGVPTGDILLPGLNYGFIGGCCGLVSQDILAFYGNLKYHSYGNDIKKFLFKHNVKPLYLSDERLIDRGSILTLL